MPRAPVLRNFMRGERQRAKQARVFVRLDLVVHTRKIDKSEVWIKDNFASDRSNDCQYLPVICQLKRESKMDEV